MFDYLQQFNSLSKDLRDRVSSPSAMAALTELENKYKIDLAMVVMKVMIKGQAVKDLPVYFMSELGLSQANATALTREMTDKIFSAVAGYLGVTAATRALDLDKDIEVLIGQANLKLASADLVLRFKNILTTYLRGVRSKIDARAALARNVKIGGLNLSLEEIDRIFKVCDQKTFKSLAAAPAVAPTPPATRLDKIMAGAASSGALRTEEYNLKQAITSGQIKRPAPLDATHEIGAPAPELDLPRPEAPVLPVPAAPQPVAPKIVPPEVKPIPTIVKTIVTPLIKPTIISPLAAFPGAVPVKPAAPSPIKPVSPANRPAPAPSANRPQMHDIRPVPKVMGPLEELRFLDLVNFRRLGKTPQEATAKVFAKIKLLEGEGYDKMIAGVKAWRQSPVNRLYITLIQDAVNKGLPLKELLAARAADKEVLSSGEIAAVIALNGKLIF